MQGYIKRERLLDLRTEVQTVPPNEDVGHVGNAPVRRRWVQLRTSPVVNVVLYKERVQREQAVSAELSNTAHVYCGDAMCNGNMLSCATGIRIGLGNVIMCGLIQIMNMSEIDIMMCEPSYGLGRSKLGAVSLNIICRNNELILYVIVIGLTVA